MDPLTIGIASVVALFILILIGFHIGIALALTSFVSVYFIGGERISVASSLLRTAAYSAIGDYVYAVVPLFILMGLFMTAAGVTRDLFNAAEVALRRVRGGLGIATVGSNAIFAAITGVSVASAAVFSKLAVPEMLRLNYNLRFSLGIVASASLLGMLIPPSIMMIVYAVLTEQSIGTVFAAGIIPGLLVAVALSVGIWVMCRLRPELDGHGLRTAQVEVSEGSLKTVIKPWPIYLLIAVVLGGIYGGIFTPTEAGAAGAFGGLCILIASRRFTWKGFFDLLLDTGKSTATIFFLLIAATMYSRMLSLSGLPGYLTGLVTHLDIAPILVVLAFLGILLVLGMILDSVSILLLTMPIMGPVVVSLGLDPIWFGILAILTIELGLLTPPFGLVIFAMKSALPDNVTLEDIYIGSAPFLVVLLLVIGLLLAFPQITLFLPQLLS